jgi:hypothetical protein
MNAARGRAHRAPAGGPRGRWIAIRKPAVSRLKIIGSMNLFGSCALRECATPRAMAIKEVEDEIFAGARRALPRPGARPVLLSVSAAATASGSIRGTGAGSLCRAGADAAARRLSTLRSGLALGARASQPVWTMGPRTLRAAPLPLADSGGGEAGHAPAAPIPPTPAKAGAHCGDGSRPPPEWSDRLPRLHHSAALRPP